MTDHPGQVATRTDADGRPKRPILSTRRIVTSLLLALAGFGVVLAFQSHHERTVDRAGPVRVVSPRPGTSVLRQLTIFAELDTDFVVTDFVVTDTGGQPTSVLSDTQSISGLNRVSYTPGGPGSKLDPLAPGNHCALVSYRRASDPNAPVGTYKWCFRVS